MGPIFGSDIYFQIKTSYIDFLKVTIFLSYNSKRVHLENTYHQWAILRLSILTLPIKLTQLYNKIIILTLIQIKSLSLRDCGIKYHSFSYLKEPMLCVITRFTNLKT